MVSFLLLEPELHTPLDRERCYRFMSKKKEPRQSEAQTYSGRESQGNISKHMWAVIGAIGGVIFTLVLTLAVSNFFTLPVDIKYLEKKIDDLSDDFSAFSIEMRQETKNLNDTDSKFWKEVYEIKALSSGAIITASASQELSFAISKALNGPDFPGKAPVVQFLSDTVVAQTKGEGQVIKAEDIANHKSLLSYESGGQEVVFYGQINENGYWDGSCILNTYRDNKLELITDAIYLNGKLLSCKQVFYYTMSSGQVVWAYADRLSEESFSTGATWLYAKESDYYKDFKLGDVTKDDVLTADDFRDTIKSKKIAYYYGNTANGYFNDSTGNAYMIHYFEDGSVKLLYSGNFVDGLCHDTTGNAWQIVREENTNYMCYKGQFENNHEKHTSKIKSFQSPLSSLSSDKLEEFWRCWNDSSTLVYLGNSMSRQDIDLIMGDRSFDGDGTLNWGYLDQLIT